MAENWIVYVVDPHHPAGMRDIFPDRGFIENLNDADVLVVVQEYINQGEEVFAASDDSNVSFRDGHWEEPLHEYAREPEDDE